MDSKNNVGMPEIKMVPLESLHKNPKNPRIIKDDKFKKLVQSIKDDPWFMRLRPIIYDENGMILGKYYVNYYLNLNIFFSLYLPLAVLVQYFYIRYTNYDMRSFFRA